MIRQLPDADRSTCERSALQPNPEVIRANVRAGWDRSAGLPDASDALRAIVDVGRQVRPRIERAGAHISAAGRRPALRRHLLFALADRTARTARSARGLG